MLTGDTVVIVRTVIMRGPGRVDVCWSNRLARAQQLINQNETGGQRRLRERNSEHQPAKSRNESPHQANYIRRRELRSNTGRSARAQARARLAGMERRDAVDSDPLHVEMLPVGKP
jgi:hypothetical protein